MYFLDSDVEELHNHTSDLERKLQSIEKDERVLTQKVRNIEAKLEAQELDNKVKAMKEAITKTFLTLWFSSEGKTPTSVVMKLQEIGFKPTRGKHDFVYEWGQQINLEDIFQLGDTVHKTIKGLKVLYKLETI